MKQDIIIERIKVLRSWMKEKGLSAFIVPTNDPHNSECVAPHWESRAWITGFTGSAGTAVVTLDKAGLWTDSRYFLQAEEQLKGTHILLFKEKLPGTETIGEWLKKEVKGHGAIGIDGWVDNGSYNEDLTQQGLSLPVYCGDPFDSIWADRPSLPMDEVFIQELKYAGESCSAKINRIRLVLSEKYASGEAILLSALDDIAWTLNLRGKDVHCNPVFISYLLIDAKQVTLYIDSKKLTARVSGYLKDNQITVKDYNDVEFDMKQQTGKVVISNSLNGQLKAALKQSISCSPSVVSLMKCVKNQVEQEGFRRAMEYDGIAMVKFLKWLINDTKASKQTELSIDQKLCSLRAEQPNYQGISFDTIAGYGTHGAIVHYEATPETDVEIGNNGLLLLDSGGQYLNGTTDLTRTIICGPVTDEMKRDYTLVLKGMLHLQNAHFPEGTCGTQLDILTRQFMWKDGINYLHGTGHGVGSFLCVHEGPHQIRMNHVPTPLRPGMTITDEPGIYKSDRYGIRIENTLLVVDDKETEFGKFYKFEPLTLCPIDKRGIELNLMNDEEIGWLNNYHQMVYNRLSSLLDEEHRIWLKDMTTPIHK